ncbi:peptide/nickel transport system permease protein/oligopeptide transport system permease protein [Phyllobacterium trifolii]|jgi:peptide/nickel transport system permease protein|uniref:Peptide/nickel transport system permease protein/oligopeptide transport system permease protein n=1 Tax=Phyllobacterium trifolii TaxID=300193 RepID=A0A839UBD8_9HYPH|nr:ABC transporter permease [Phyllobacterium trifolii]MBB3148376.1 peptide/nickel transport system permease protein/oligopeptide transport system permease protein [Phyllobacterium trifolii]
MLTEMIALIAKRILAAFFTVLAVLMLAGVLVHAVPGDPVTAMMASSASMTPDAVNEMRDRLGLDQPIWRQVGDYVLNALTGDLGTSFRANEPVALLILERLPNTLLLSVAGLGLAAMIGVPVGVAAAVNRGNGVDTFLTTIMVLAFSVPGFWLGLILMQIFALRLRWLPVAGTDLENMVLPALTLGLAYSPIVARMTRSALLDVLAEDFVRTARARGLPESQVLAVHVLRPALVNIVTILGIGFASMMGGQVIIESVFAWNGLGRLAVQAMLQRDYPVIQGFVVAFATSIVVISTCLELLYALLDPRMRRL